MRDYSIYIIIHQHWDPAWISQRKHTEPQLKTLFEDILLKMRKYPSYKFVLDGQTHIIEDYLKQLPRSELILKRKELSKYTKEGRLMVGPFYAQIDWNLAGEEVLVRNLLLGHQEAKKLGKVMKCGWVIDVFGFPLATIRILKGFDIDSIYISRGIGIEKDKIKEAYWWKDNKNKILCIHLIESYRNLMELSKTKNIAEERIVRKAETLYPYSVTKSAVLLFDGYENLTSADDIPPLINKIKNVSITSPVDYKDIILNSKVKLNNICGYLNSGKYIASLSGVLSNRVYLKNKQYLVEKLLTTYLEPWATLSYLWGDKYPKKFLKNLWKELLKISSHDELCGCSVDEVHRDALLVYNKIEKLALRRINKTLRRIAQNINTNFSKDNGISLVVFNPSPFRKKSIISARLNLSSALKGWDLSKGLHLRDSDNNILPAEIGRKNRIYAEVDISGEGYKVYKILPGKKEVKEGLKVEEADRIMENRYLKVKIEDDGTLKVLDKINKRFYENLGYFKSEGDAGDLYTADIVKDKVITSLNQNARVNLVEKNQIFSCFKIEHRLKLPRSLNKDRKSRSEELIDYPLLTYVSLTYSKPRIDLVTKVYNTAQDHRLRVCFPIKIKSTHHYIKHKFEVHKSPNNINKHNYVSRENPLKGVLSPAYDTVFPEGFSHDGFIDINNKKGGVGLITHSLPEYNLKNNTIELTLLRGVGWLGLDNLNSRKGRAGWMVRTPDAQCLGRHIFRYSLFFHPCNWFKGKLHKEAISQNTELKIVKTTSHSGFLPSSFNGWKVQSMPKDSLILSALKLSEEDNDLIIRFYNILNQKVTYKISLPFKIKSAYLVNLNEEKKDKIQIRENSLKGKMEGKEIVTIKIKIERNSLKFMNIDKSTKIILEDLPYTQRETEDKIKIPDLVTKEIIDEEKERVKSAREAVNSAKDLLKRVKEKYGGNYKFEIEKAKLKVMELNEILQDAKYSLLLTKKRYEENKKDKGRLKIIQSQIDKMAPNLILPRAQRQLQQFIVEHYQEQEEVDYEKKI